MTESIDEDGVNNLAIFLYFSMTTISEEIDVLRNICEYKKRPALVIATVYHLSEKNEDYFKTFYVILVRWISILSEIDNFLGDVLQDMDFYDLYSLADHLCRLEKRLIDSRDEETLLTARIIYEIRSQPSILDYREINNCLDEIPNSPNVLICKCFFLLSS